MREDKRNFSSLEAFLAALAGYDLNLIAEYAGTTYRHEKQKLVRIGGSVLIPAFLGFFTCYFVLSRVLEGTGTSVVGALIFSFLVLVIDSLIVSTLSKGQVFGVLIRLVISLSIGGLVAEPAILYAFHETIDARIAQDLTKEKSARLEQLKQSIESEKHRLQELNGAIDTLQINIARYSPKNYLESLASELRSRKDSSLRQLAEDKQREIERLNSELAKVKELRQQKAKEIDSKLDEMHLEEKGKRGLGLAGRGARWNALQVEKRNLAREAADLDGQAAKLGEEIKRLRMDTQDQKKIEQEFDQNLYALEHPEPGNPNPKFALPDDSEKRVLEKELSASQMQRSAVQSRITVLEADKAALDSEQSTFNPANRDDSIAQTKAFYEIILETPILGIKALLLFLVVFGLDTIAVLVKLTVPTDYEKYLEAKSQEQTVKRMEDTAKLREEHSKILLQIADAGSARQLEQQLVMEDESTIDAMQRRNERLIDYSNTLAAKIRLGAPHPFVHQRKVFEFINRMTDKMLSKMDHGAIYEQPAKRRRGLFDIVLTPFRALGSSIKAKLAMLSLR